MCWPGPDGMGQAAALHWTAGMAVLILLRDEVPLVRFALGEVATLGRASECEVQLVDTELSRRHAQVRRTATGWELEDLGSRNGTRVDGVRVQGAVPLAPGAVIALGMHTLVFDPPVDVVGDEIARQGDAEADAAGLEDAVLHKGGAVDVPHRPAADVVLHVLADHLDALVIEIGVVGLQRGGALAGVVLPFAEALRLAGVLFGQGVIVGEDAHVHRHAKDARRGVVARGIPGPVQVLELQRQGAQVDAHRLDVGVLEIGVIGAHVQLVGLPRGRLRVDEEDVIGLTGLKDVFQRRVLLRAGTVGC
ncbi:FHA domain-containing protein [bacterium]|nr:MAG: FHA domain-containing protein [bacterium]